MPRLISVSGKKMCKIVERLGFQKVHQVGSHIRYIHLDGRKTTIPFHSNEEIGVSLLSDILKQIRITRDEYEKLRRQV